MDPVTIDVESSPEHLENGETPKEDTTFLEEIGDEQLVKEETSEADLKLQVEEDTSLDDHLNDVTQLIDSEKNGSDDAKIEEETVLVTNEEIEKIVNEEKEESGNEENGCEEKEENVNEEKEQNVSDVVEEASGKLIEKEILNDPKLNEKMSFVVLKNIDVICVDEQEDLIIKASVDELDEDINKMETTETNPASKTTEIVKDKKKNDPKEVNGKDQKKKVNQKRPPDVYKKSIFNAQRGMAKRRVALMRKIIAATNMTNLEKYIAIRKLMGDWISGNIETETRNWIKNKYFLNPNRTFVDMKETELKWIENDLTVSVIKVNDKINEMKGNNLKRKIPVAKDKQDFKKPKLENANPHSDKKQPTLKNPTTPAKTAIKPFKNTYPVKSPHEKKTPYKSNYPNESKTKYPARRTKPHNQTGSPWAPTRSEPNMNTNTAIASLINNAQQIVALPAIQQQLSQVLVNSMLQNMNPKAPNPPVMSTPQPVPIMQLKIEKPAELQNYGGSSKKPGKRDRNINPWGGGSPQRYDSDSEKESPSYKRTGNYQERQKQSYRSNSRSSERDYYPKKNFFTSNQNQRNKQKKPVYSQTSSTNFNRQKTQMTKEYYGSNQTPTKFSHEGYLQKNVEYPPIQNSTGFGLKPTQYGNVQEQHNPKPSSSNYSNYLESSFTQYPTKTNQVINPWGSENQRYDSGSDRETPLYNRRKSPPRPQKNVQYPNPAQRSDQYHQQFMPNFVPKNKNLLKKNQRNDFEAAFNQERQRRLMQELKELQDGSRHLDKSLSSYI